LRLHRRDAILETNSSTQQRAKAASRRLDTSKSCTMDDINSFSKRSHFHKDLGDIDARARDGVDWLEAPLLFSDWPEGQPFFAFGKPGGSGCFWFPLTMTQATHN
jgi:hypothetical protein